MSNPASGESNIPQGVQFNVAKLVEVDPAIQTLAELAITAVWQHHVTEPTAVNLTFANRIVLEMPDGGTELVNSLYQGDTDTINIALGTLQERHPDTSLGIMTVLHAGHEARRKVQAAISDAPPDSNQGIVDGTYTDSRHEVEAWESAVQAFSAVYPGELVSFPVGSQIYSNQATSERIRLIYIEST